MKLAGLCLALALLAAPCSLASRAAAEPAQADIGAANLLFKSGKFAEAGEIYAQIAARDAKNLSVIVQLGRIALLSDKLDDAQTWLEQAIALKPDDADAKVMLAEALYRRDDFRKAAEALHGVDVATNQLIIAQYPTLNVAKLESFKGQTPYEVEGGGQTTRVQFLKTEPLPLVSVRVNGGEEVVFFIDTGGSEVVLDTAFAKELGLPQFGKVQGTFSGGQHADVQQSRLESLTVGDWTIKTLPATTMPLRQLSEGFGVKRLDGILGTTLFYHFLATLDYPRGELVLRRKTEESLKQFLAEPAANSTAVPMWMASDHFMVAWGRVEAMPPALLFVDSGLAGAGVKLAESVIEDAGIKLEQDRAYEGAGGGGTLKVVPYTVHRLSLGGVQEENVPGLYDGPFPWESSFGFHLAGMVGHDFLKPYAVTFDFQNMQIVLRQRPGQSAP